MLYATAPRSKAKSHAYSSKHAALCEYVGQRRKLLRWVDGLCKAIRGPRPWWAWEDREAAWPFEEQRKPEQLGILNEGAA